MRHMILRIAVFAWVLGLASTATAAANDGNESRLTARYQSLQNQLNSSPFGRPLALDSAETGTTLQGDLYARLDHPYATVKAALTDPAHWCDVLILHLNTKYCRPRIDNSGSILAVSMGKKHDQALEDAHRVEFNYQVASANAQYMQVRLHAATGPLSTRDYRIQIEAIPVDGKRTFLHLTYSYSSGFTGRMAMKTYLATIARDKVGFTVLGKAGDGEPRYINGVRGVVERNAMRYYLAIDAYLAAPAVDQLDQRLQGWFAATEQYARQLHEVDRAAYLKMKRNEYARQQRTS